MRTKSPEQIKSEFRSRGQTLKSWAVANGFPPTEVYRVLSGLSKAKYGLGHEIAVRIGLKQQG